MGMRLLLRTSVNVVAILALGQTAFAKTPYEEAITSLEAGAYAEAASSLSTLVEANPTAAGYHNLALAQHGLGERGEATWAMLMSESLGGVDRQAKLRNVLLKRLPAELKPLSSGPLEGLARQMSRLLPSYLLSLLALLGLGVGLTVLVLAYRPQVKLQSTWRWLSLGCLLLGAGSLLLANQINDLRDAPWAATIESTALYASPSEQSERLRTLPVGTPLQLGERIGDMYATTLPTGKSGWVPSSALRRVSSISQG